MEHPLTSNSPAADDPLVILSVTKPKMHSFFQKRTKKETNAKRQKALGFSEYAVFPSSMFYKCADVGRMRGDSDYTASGANSFPRLDFHYIRNNVPRIVQAPAGPGVFKELPAPPQSIDDLCFLREVARKIKSFIAAAETKDKRRHALSIALPSYITEETIQKDVFGANSEEWGFEGPDFIPNIFVVCGPHGTGKTSMARLLSKEVNHRLTYIDCLTSENGRLFNQLLEANAFQPNAFDHDVKHSSQLVLIDDIEIAFEEDTSFWSSASRFLQEANQNVIVTCNDYDSMRRSVALPHGSVVFRISCKEPACVLFENSCHLSQFRPVAMLEEPDAPETLWPLHETTTGSCLPLRDAESIDRLYRFSCRQFKSSLTSSQFRHEVLPWMRLTEILFRQSNAARPIRSVRRKELLSRCYYTQFASCKSAHLFPC